MFEIKIFEQIREFWVKHHNRYRQNLGSKGVPSTLDLKTLIEEAFLASLIPEEGQFCGFSLVLLDKPDSGGNFNVAGSSQEILVFRQELPFNPEVLGKLAPVCDPRLSSIVVSPVAGTSVQYQISGIMFFSAAESSFRQIPVGTQFYTSRPDAFTITAVSPGSLLLSRGASQVGRFSQGCFVPSTPTPFTTKGMGNFMIASIHRTRGYQDYGASYWHIYRNALEYLLFASSNRGHGSTIIVIPKNQVHECSPCFRSNYYLDNPLRIQELMTHSIGDSTTASAVDVTLASLGKLAYNLEISNRLDFLAQLACSDGALLLDHNLEPIAFGATLFAKKWGGVVLEGPDGIGGSGQCFDLSRLGTRHNSAANFIGEFPFCYGFVVSQDGPIRGFSRQDENTLFCWPNCKVSMFVDL